MSAAQVDVIAKLTKQFEAEAIRPLNVVFIGQRETGNTIYQLRASSVQHALAQIMMWGELLVGNPESHLPRVQMKA